MALFEIKKVVTAFLKFGDEILLLRRSDAVGSYRDLWAGVSGYLETGEDPLKRVFKELEEETSLPPESYKLISRGDPFPVIDEGIGVIWLVHPFLFETSTPLIKTDWEHKESRWVKPEDLEKLRTVPKLAEALERVMPKARSWSPEIMERIEAIRNDHVHSATWLAGEALRTLAVVAKLHVKPTLESLVLELKSIGRELMKLRPSMASLTNMVGRLLFKILEKANTCVSTESLRSFVISEVQNEIQRSKESIEAIAELFSNYITGEVVILTHSYSTSVLEALKSAYQIGKSFSVIITESRPRLEGRTLAGELSKLRIPATVITDAAAGYFMRHADIALVGADSILADGSVVNKAGTYSIALAAKDLGKPFIVACESSKFNLRSLFSEEIPLEEADPGELGLGELPSGISARNICFDVTPARFVSDIITEEGIVKPQEVRSKLEAMLRRTYL
jgi:eIF-2B alpha/beta/delta-like uncharacterized protein